MRFARDHSIRWPTDAALVLQFSASGPPPIIFQLGLFAFPMSGPCRMFAGRPGAWQTDLAAAASSREFARVRPLAERPFEPEATCPAPLALANCRFRWPRARDKAAPRSPSALFWPHFRQNISRPRASPSGPSPARAGRGRCGARQAPYAELISFPGGRRHRKSEHRPLVRAAGRAGH